MSRLEQYKDFLIPIDDVAYAEYRNPNKNAVWSEEQEGGTFVWLWSHDGMTRSIRISKKNILIDFQKWYKKFSESDKVNTAPINKGLSDWDKNTTPSWPKGFCPYINGEIWNNPFIKFVEKDGEPINISPKADWHASSNGLAFKNQDGSYTINLTASNKTTK